MVSAQQAATGVSSSGNGDSAAQAVRFESGAVISSRVFVALLATMLAPSTTACAEEAAPTPPNAAAALPPIAFATSAVHEAPSALYQVWVDLPPSYAASTKPLPVVFVLDPHWALPVNRSVRALVGQRGHNIEVTSEVAQGRTI